MKTNKKTAQAFYPTLADALLFPLQQLFHSSILPSSSPQHKTILSILPLPLACSFHLSWRGNAGAAETASVIDAVPSLLRG